MKQPTQFFIKKIATTLIVALMVNIVLCLIICFSSINKVKVIDVSVKDLKERTYQSVKLEGNSFQTGTEGRLHWKVKDAKEAVLVSLANPNGPINIYDLITSGFLFFVIYWVSRGMKDDTVFTGRMGTGLMVLAYGIILYPFYKMLVVDKVSRFAIEELTQGRFHNQYREINIGGYFLFGLALQLVPHLYKKALQMQKETDLTI